MSCGASLSVGMAADAQPKPDRTVRRVGLLLHPPEDIEQRNRGHGCGIFFRLLCPNLAGFAFRATRRPGSVSAVSLPRRPEWDAWRCPLGDALGWADRSALLGSEIAERAVPGEEVVWVPESVCSDLDLAVSTLERAGAGVPVLRRGMVWGRCAFVVFERPVFCTPRAESDAVTGPVVGLRYLAAGQGVAVEMVEAMHVETAARLIAGARRRHFASESVEKSEEFAARVAAERHASMPVLSLSPPRGQKPVVWRPGNWHSYPKVPGLALLCTSARVWEFGTALGAADTQERALFGLLYALWQFAASPWRQAAARRPRREAREAIRRTERAVRRDPRLAERLKRFRVVDLPVRRAGAGDQPEAAAGGAVRRHWVRGHWRRQFYPSLDAHAPVWIATHVRGSPFMPWAPKRKVVHRLNAPPAADSTPPPEV